jgi:hypothetical protein
MIKDYSKIVGDMIKEHDDKISLIQKQIYEELLVPFCRKNRLKFYSGMGVYSFSRENEKKYFSSYIDKDSFTGKKLIEYQELVDALNILPYTRAEYSIGTYMDNYPKRT